MYALFSSSPELLRLLKSKVTCPIGQTVRMRSTGLNAQTLILRCLQLVELCMKELCSDLKLPPNDIRKSVRDELEANAAASGTVSRDFIERQFAASRNEDYGRIMSMLEEIRSGRSAAPAEAEPPQASVTAKPIYPMQVWSDGTHHAVSETFRLPLKISPLLAWQQYCCGDAAHGFPPLRVLKAVDMSFERDKKRMGDLKWLMGCMKKKLLQTAK